MMDSLGLLVIVFAGMSVISVLGIVLMCFVKKESVRKGLFYFLAIWGMIVAYCNVQMIPIYMTGEVILAWALGGLSVAALLIQLCMKNEKRFAIARALVVISVVAGMIDAFMF